LQPAALISGKSPSKILVGLALSVVFGLQACGGQFIPHQEKSAPAKEFLRLEATTFDKVPGWAGDSQAEALPVFLRSCEKIKTHPPSPSLDPDKETRRAADWQQACNAARPVRPGNEIEAQYFFETHFTPYRASNSGNTKGLFTGYYEPELRGAWQPSPTFRYPIYARPKDLVSIKLGDFRAEFKGQQTAGRLMNGKVTPYPTRADINDGVLKGRQLELLWVDDAIDAFFLHVQGSGQVVFADGSRVRLAFAGKNGHRYTPIGREMVAMGYLSEKKVSLQSIRQWLEANPIAGTEMMERNKSYVFFRLLDGDGPIGAQGVALTPGRSLAVDRKHISLGTPIWLNTTEPGRSGKPLRRLVIAQDTGSAIRGPVRGDFFVGFGNAAAEMAGRMNQGGTYFLLLPKKALPQS